MSLQILAWMASGLYFSVFPIAEIRGEHLTRPAERVTADALAALITPAEAWDAAVRGMPEPRDFGDIELVRRSGTVWYRVSGHADGESFARLVNGATGAVAARLEADAARALAESYLTVPAQLAAVEWVDSAPPDSEIRGRQLPLWRVSFSEPESLNLYLDPWTGDLISRRTTRWRIFDFLWMLHILDFETRDDFNTPLLQWAAGLGLLVALSGVVFWLLTTRLLRRRRMLTG